MLHNGRPPKLTDTRPGYAGIWHRVIRTLGHACCWAARTRTTATGQRQARRHRERPARTAPRTAAGFEWPRGGRRRCTRRCRNPVGYAYYGYTCSGCVGYGYAYYGYTVPCIGASGDVGRAGRPRRRASGLTRSSAAAWCRCTSAFTPTSRLHTNTCVRYGVRRRRRRSRRRRRRYRRHHRPRVVTAWHPRCRLVSLGMLS